MKKLIVLITLISCALLAGAQTLKDYKAINGVTYKIGDIVKLGRGSSPKGDFLYLQMGGWGAIMGYDSNKGSNQFNIGKGYANLAVKIKKIKWYELNGVQKIVFTVGGGI